MTFQDLDMMSDRNNAEAVRDNAQPFTLTEVMAAFAVHRKAIGGVAFAAAGISAAIAFAIPASYQATATLLPPQQAQSGAAALLSQLGNAAGAVAGAAGIKNSSDLYMGILKSRSIADELVKGQGLLAVYGTDSMEQARAELKERTAISSGKDGLISIAVEDRDKGRAAQLANAYVDSLTKLTKVLALTEASQRRLFFEQQLEAAKNKLAAAELALKRGLDAKGVISVDADSRTVLETTAKLRARISAKEVEVNAMRSFVTENNNEFKRAEAELASLRRELSTLENGRAVADQAEGSSDKKPGLDNIKLLRDVRYQQMLYELLAKQYEAARLDEARDSSVIQVLDHAVAPERKSKPRRSTIVLGATLLAFAASLAGCYLLERRKRALGLGHTGGTWKTLRLIVNGN
jgi:uncharacterized protein involved in exopolysaccharide biosynthesis